MVPEPPAQTLPARAGKRPADGRAGPPRIWSSGFIANRRELLAGCNLPGTASDRELLGLLLRRHGAGAARRIEGPFSWIAVDPGSGNLQAARDRTGARALYWAESNGEVLVGPRVDPLRRLLPRVTPNQRSLVALMQTGAAPPGETCYREIHALEPGMLLVAADGAARTESYWRLERQPILRLGSDAAFAEALRALLLDVAARYRPAGPTAVALSSGLDSTAVAAALHAAGGGGSLSLLTCSTRELPAADETAGATAVAEHLGLPLELIRGDQLWPLSSGGARALPDGPVTAYREVWAALFERARGRGARVVYTGTSGDHLLGGTGVLVYPDLLLSGRWLRLWSRLLEHRRSSGRPLTKLIYGQLLRPLVEAQLPRRWALRRRRLPWLGRRGRALLGEALPRETGRWRRLPGRRLRLQALRDAALPHALAMLGALADEHGVELRHPLADHRLLEFAASLPLEQCLRAGRAKYVLRNAMRGLLPPEIVNSSQRIYPRALFERGLRERGREKVWELLTGMRAAELDLVDEAALQETYRRYLAGKGSTVFWHTLTVEDWLRRHA